MKLLENLFRDKAPKLQKSSGEFKTSDEKIAEVTDGANLVDGQQTWELANEKKHDIEVMKKCCDSELNTMEKADMVAAPYYFERVAILSQKEKNYEQEIAYCEKYIDLVEAYYQIHGTSGIADVRKGPRYQAVQKRLPKAKELLARNG